MGLYENIRYIAKNKGYSINRLEKELGFSRSSIGKFNNNKPSIDKLQKIAVFLDVSVDFLTSGGEMENPKIYHLNDETAAIAQEIFDNPDLRILFDALRNASPEDLKTVRDMMLALKRKENNWDNEGC